MLLAASLVGRTHDRVQVEFASVFRDGTRVEAGHGTHVDALFRRAAWRALLRVVGFRMDEFA